MYVLSDEVYKDLIYVRENYLIKGPHVVTINSFSKTFAMCGFRVGYLWSLDQELVEEVIAVKTHTSMNTNILGQEMALAAVGVSSDFAEKQLEVWRNRRDLIWQGLSDLGLDLWKPEGAFYVMPRVEEPLDFVRDRLRALQGHHLPRRLVRLPGPGAAVVRPRRRQDRGRPRTHRAVPGEAVGAVGIGPGRFACGQSRGNGRTAMKATVAILGSCLLFAAGPGAGTDCDGWNTKEFFKEFFKTATVEDVASCLQAGADPVARDEEDNTTPALGSREESEFSRNHCSVERRS